jgi:hypothetical protein
MVRNFALEFFKNLDLNLVTEPDPFMRIVTDPVGSGAIILTVRFLIYFVNAGRG